MLQKIIIKGLASSKTREIEVTDDDLDKSLLSFLSSKGIPVASSCSGKAKCHKCVFNEEILSCDEKVKDWIGEEIRFGYM